MIILYLCLYNIYSIIYHDIFTCIHIFVIRIKKYIRNEHQNMDILKNNNKQRMTLLLVISIYKYIKRLILINKYLYYI